MEEPSEADIAELLADPDCPWFDNLTPPFRVRLKMPWAPQASVHDSAASADFRLLLVEWFLAFARSRGLTSPAVEAVADTHIHNIGGERQSVHDLGRRLRNALRRVRRRPPAAQEYIWVVPKR
jgi:hypothetical protein